MDKYPFPETSQILLEPPCLLYHPRNSENANQRGSTGPYPAAWLPDDRTLPRETPSTESGRLSLPKDKSGAQDSESCMS